MVMRQPLPAAAVVLLLLLAASSCGAAPAHGSSSVVRPHTHRARKLPSGFSTVAGTWATPTADGERPPAASQQLVPLAPLLPACVPKYATPLLLPPPMPLATSDLARDAPLPRPATSGPQRVGSRVHYVEPTTPELAEHYRRHEYRRFKGQQDEQQREQEHPEQEQEQRSRRGPEEESEEEEHRDHREHDGGERKEREEHPPHHGHQRHHHEADRREEEHREKQRHEHEHEVEQERRRAQRRAQDEAEEAAEAARREQQARREAQAARQRAEADEQAALVARQRAEADEQAAKAAREAAAREQAEIEHEQRRRRDAYDEQAHYGHADGGSRRPQPYDREAEERLSSRGSSMRSHYDAEADDEQREAQPADDRVLTGVGEVLAHTVLPQQVIEQAQQAEQAEGRLQQEQPLPREPSPRRELPPRELPPRELPPRELPPRELPPGELPPRERRPALQEQPGRGRLFAQSQQQSQVQQRLPQAGGSSSFLHATSTIRGKQFAPAPASLFNSFHARMFPAGVAAGAQQPRASGPLPAHVATASTDGASVGVAAVDARRDAPSLDDEYWESVFPPSSSDTMNAKDGKAAPPSPAPGKVRVPRGPHAPAPPHRHQPPPYDQYTLSRPKPKANPAPEPEPSPSPEPEPSPSPESEPTPSPAPEPSPQPPPPPPPQPREDYHISARRIAQSVLPPQPNALPECPAVFGPTDVFAYGPADNPAAHNWPGFSIEAKRGLTARVKWTNDLVDDVTGAFLPHILQGALDQTLHWANPEAVGGTTDSSPCHACRKPGMPPGACAADPACVRAATAAAYTGPVPTVTHVHGASDLHDFSDGYTEAWSLPKASNIPAGVSPVGSWYSTFAQQAAAKSGLTWTPGSATFEYTNTQRPSTRWYHDHTLGLTRLNVYSGLAGFFFIRDHFPSLVNGPELPGLPYPANDGLVDPSLIRELPLAIQDRAFTNDSQLWYPVADLLPGEALPQGELPPRWLPELSATVLMGPAATPVNNLMFTVNGRTYPYQTVYPDAYRLRILNGCNTRTMQLKFARAATPQIAALDPAATADLLPFWVVGNEGGFFPQLQPPVTALQAGPAERFDVVIDFSGVAPGEFVFMLNNGPEPDTAVYSGTNNGLGLTEHTAQIMRFDVSPLPANQTARPFDAAAQASLGAALQRQYGFDVAPLSPGLLPTRRVALLEKLTPNGTPLAVLLGTAGTNTAAITPWDAPVSADITMDADQMWDIINLSADAHPIHLHGFDMRFMGRWVQNITLADPVAGFWAFEDTELPAPNADLDHLLQMPCVSDASGTCAVPKDTIMALPGARTRIGFRAPRAQFSGLSESHIAEPEGEVVVPMCLGSPSYVDPKTGAPMCPGPNGDESE